MSPRGSRWASRCTSRASGARRTIRTARGLKPATMPHGFRGLPPSGERGRQQCLPARAGGRQAGASRGREHRRRRHVRRPREGLEVRDSRRVAPAHSVRAGDGHSPWWRDRRAVENRSFQGHDVLEGPSRLGRCADRAPQEQAGIPAAHARRLEVAGPLRSPRGRLCHGLVATSPGHALRHSSDVHREKPSASLPPSGGGKRCSRSR